MTNFKTGFIGCGNMATAIINGILDKNIIKAQNINLYDLDNKKAIRFKGANVSQSIDQLAVNSDIIFLCVKPNVLQQVASKISAKGKAVVSIAAGVGTDKLFTWLPDDTRLLRIMPNTPLMVGKGASVFQQPDNLTDNEREFIYKVFSSLGTVEKVNADEMDAVTGISGSGPAYVYLFVDALAKAGEKQGLNADVSFSLALQTFNGACEMLKKSDKTPDSLIKDVCSPGGTTIEAMKVFEDENLRLLIEKAVEACVNRSKELSGS